MAAIVELIGEINDAEKPDFLSSAIALLLPIDWPEPFGLVMIEAMACGTPVIAFNRGSVPEVIEDGVTGLIVEDEAEAGEATSRVQRLSRASVRRSFERRFTAQRMADTTGVDIAAQPPGYALRFAWWVRAQRPRGSRAGSPRGCRLPMPGDGRCGRWAASTWAASGSSAASSEKSPGHAIIAAVRRQPGRAQLLLVAFDLTPDLVQRQLGARGTLGSFDLHG